VDIANKELADAKAELAAAASGGQKAKA